METEITGASDSEIEPRSNELEQSRLAVVVRVRPIGRTEGGRNLVTISDSCNVTVRDPQENQNIPEEAFRIARVKEKSYTFDAAFDGNSTQSDVYEKTTKPLLDGVTDGRNATVFAYGATGAGKTHTMLGNEQRPGIMIKTIEDLFQGIQRNKRHKYTIRLSYVEIYNEMARDLIHVSNETLDLREDPLRGVVISGLSEITVTSTKEIMELIISSNKNRTTESTRANVTSSRSHAVLQITVEHSESSKQLAGKLSLIDLAGSERAAQTQNRGIRLIEGANINRSLLALGNCINALYEMHKRGPSSKMHIPYRDSKLTRLLKDSLAGNCNTVMIACISPTSLQYEDTLNTLKYANRAKNIKTSARLNLMTTTDPSVGKYVSAIAQLKNQVADLKAQLGKKSKSMDQ